MPAAVTAGQLLLACVTLEGTQPFGGHIPTITTPAGWPRLWYASLGNGTTARFAGYAKIADGTEAGATVNFVTDDAANGAAQVHRVDKWSGALAGVPVTTAPFGGHIPTMTTPAGWSRLWYASLGNGTTARFAGYAKIADGTEAGATVNFVTDDDANGAAQVHRVDKWSGALAGVQVSSVAVGGSAAPNSPSLTATWGKGRTLDRKSTRLNSSH